MPPIQSVTIEQNRLTIVSHYGTLVLGAGDIPGNVKSQGIPAIEGWVNDWLAQPAQRAVTGCFVAVHVFSFAGGNISWTFCTSDIPITGQWW